MHLRKFVLQPLTDIRPDLILQGQTKTIADLFGELEDRGSVVSLASHW